jgi:hypothetical protein
MGTISHGTLRYQDLIPKFMEVLRLVDAASYEEMFLRPLPPPDAEDDDPWWESDDAQWLLEDLFECLDHAAPEGCYFGAHPGDGSDFGFWEVDDGL